ncbi:xylulokinase [Thiothrix litoralis]|uniref:Xylulose kinase n=1 Tax=Thiothrix litoralis TaxID=2891210 RepID=A0ABX7WZ34_9GAMM|nr:xylulokinase [Thiothrix litoralis]QTR47558.1 xylulokinase [Thiothrix litoralis]
MYIGIDIGTSGVKTLLMNEQQTIIGSAHAGLSVTRLHSGWSEQHPADWISATQTTLDTLAQQFPAAMAAVRGLSLSGQMHGATLLDKDHQVLRPCLLWNDTRSHLEAAALDANPLFRQMSGNIVFPGFTAPKLLWVKHHEPAIFDQVAQVLLPKDYVRLWLTGETVSDMSDASGTSWLDVAGRCWSDELLAASSMQRSQMPRLVEGTENSGALRTVLAKRWGMQQSPLVAGGAGDNAASACGMGVVQAGSAFVSLGTSGVLFAANATYLPNPGSAVHAFCHAIPDTWHQMGVILSATDALNWYAGITAIPAAALTAALGEHLSAPSGITFLPYLSGERTPHNDATIRGAFIGLEHQHTRQHLTQAVLEGVAFAIRDNLGALNAAGTNLQRLTAVGGGSKSHYWLRLIATVLNLPVDIPADGDFGGAFGAARLALIAANNADPLSVCQPPPIKQSIAPQSALTVAYEDAYQRYRAVYPLLKQR